MLKTLKIEIMEVVDSSQLNREKIYNSLASSCLHECDCDMFFLLDKINYKAFINYFSNELDNKQKEEILNFFK